MEIKTLRWLWLRSSLHPLCCNSDIPWLTNTIHYPSGRYSIPWLHSNVANTNSVERCGRRTRDVIGEAMGNQEVVQINFGVAVVGRTSRYEVGAALLSEGTGCNKASQGYSHHTKGERVNTWVTRAGFFYYRGHVLGLLGPRRVFLPSPFKPLHLGQKSTLLCL